MASARIVTKQVKPILSSTPNEAKRRVLNLYKAVLRYAPEIVRYYAIPMSLENIRLKIRKDIRKNQNLKDLRLIDLLVAKSQMDLQEMVTGWQSKEMVMKHLEEKQCQPSDFLSKFLSGIES